jgi:lysophospholipase L1-like esterase
VTITAPRRAWIAVALAALLTLPALNGLPAMAAPRPVKIIVLGDSYAAGNGAGFYYGPQGCYRSQTGWVEQYAGGLRAAGYQVTLVNRACSGAETHDILNDRVMESASYTIPLLGDRRTDEAAARQMLTGLGLCVAQYPEEERYDISATTTFDGLITAFTFTCTRVLAAQIHAVGSDADLVLMTVGGNDVQFSTLVRDCFVFPTPAGCRATVQRANSLLGVVQERITSTLTAIGGRLNPSARVGLVSYPYLEKSDDFTITSLLPLDSYRAGEEVRKLGRSGDEIQAAAVNAANPALGRHFASFVGGVKGRFAGHEPDGNILLFNPQGWFHEVTSPIPAEWYHLNVFGHAAYANLMLGDPTSGSGGL